MSKRSFQVSIDFLGNISDLQNKIKTLSGDLSKIGATSGGVNVQKQFDQLAQSLQNLQTKAKQPITSQGEFNKLMQEVNKVEGSYNNLLATLEGLYNLSNTKKLELLPKEEQQRIRQAAQAIKTFETNTKAASSSIKELKSAQDKANTALDNQAAAQKTFKSLTAQVAVAEKEYKDLATAANNLADAQEKYNNLFYKTGKRAGQQKDNVSNEQVAEAAAKLTEAKAKADELRGAYDNIGTAAAEVGKRAQTLSNLKIKASQELTKAQEAANRLSKELEELKVRFEASSGQQLQQSFEQLKNKAKELGISLEGIGDKATTSGIDLLKQRLQSLETQGLERVDQGIVKTIATTQGGLLPALQNVRLEADKSRDSFDGFTRAMNDVEGLKSRIGYFFSMTNSVMLLRRALTSALNTVKELDAVMTETAVVTDFTVGDMWEKLPEYASHANALGASIKELYSATTLYYQQGLQTEAAMGVGIETMKMARIAGMEAADATEAMTAALRGFNMEVNETNAVRVNDVYSELAAITAADTEQIATAMSKTASIAASANMEFETTAALLAQIIETTQEAPETAGTALKTIIARFSEVKKLREEGANTGEDEEGEAIDVNKIQGALRTVGISMDDFFAGAEGLDSILLKLAEKWKDLDFETQRYIATTAAGSRQQSRFIAMMSDYERTMELATAANNSAGASQQQFDKTLESMEAKLQKLKNAWNEFTMGLANNEILKFGVDVLTGLLNTVNKLTSSLSGGNGLVKSVINLVTVIGALKGGASIVRGLFGESGMLKKHSAGFLTSIIGKDSTSKAAAQGQKDGMAYANGFKRAIQTKKTGARIGQQFGALIGKEAVVSIGNMTEEQLDESIGKLKTRTLNSSGKNTSTGVSWKSYSVQDITADQAVELKNTLKDFDAGKITYDEADAACQKYGTSMKELTQMVKTTALDFTSMGMAAVGAGTAISLLGGLFDKLGLEGLGKGLKTAGSILTGFGSIVMMIGPLITKLGISFTTAGIALNGALVAPMASILAIAGPVVIALGALVAMLWAIHEASPEVQLKKAQEAAAQAAEAANEAAEAYNNLKSSLESIEEKETILEELTIGTQEWKNAVQELNNQILDLIELYPQLAEFISYNESGILTISEEGKNLALDKHLQRQQNTQTAKIGANINELRAQQNLDYSELDSNLKIVIEEKIESSNYENNNTISSEFKKRQQEILDSQTPHYGSESAFLEQNTVKNYDKEETEALARAIASGDWKGREEQIATITGTSDPKEFVNTEEYKELRNFGQALIESDAAIKIYTDSLENAAILNADVSEEYKDKISGIYDTESIENMLTKEKENIDLSENREYWEKEYAKAMNYQYENGKFYSGKGENKKEVTVLDQDIKSQLAAINVQKAMTDNLSKVSNELENLHNSGIKLGQSFINMASKADGAGFTLQDISSLKGKFDGAYQDNVESDINGNFTSFKDAELQTLYSQVKDIYSPEEFYRIFSDAYSQASERASQAQYKLSSMGLKGQFDSAKIDTGALFEISNSLYDVFLRSGSEATQQLGQKLSEITSSLSPENAQIFAEALNSLDWNNIDSIKELDTILSGMGFTGQIKDIEALEQQIISAAKAGRDFSLEKVREELKSLANLKTDLKERIEDENYTFTEEEKDEYLKEMPELKERFIQTDADEWVYIGGYLEDLQGALNENTKALLAKTEEDAKGKAQEAQKWIDLMDSTKQYEYTSKRFNDTGTAEYTVSESGTFSEVVSGILDGTILDTEVMVSVLESLNADTSGNMSDLVNRIEMLFTENYGTNGTVAASNITNYEDAQKATSSVALSYKNPYELAGMVQNTTTQYNGSVLETQVVDNSVYLDALNAQANQAKVTTAEIERLTKAQEEQGKSGDEAKAAALAQAISMKKQQVAINEASEAIGEYLETMDDAEEDSVAYNEALSKIPKQIEKAFGFKPDTEWVQDNLDLIKEWAAGSEEAGAQIWENLTNGFSSAMAACEANVGQSVTNMVDWLNWFSGTNVWANAYLDNSGFMNAIATSETEAKEFADWLETQGYETELIVTGTKPVTYKGMIYDGSMMREHVYTVNQPQYQVKWKNTGNPWTGGGGGGYDAPSSYTPKSGGGGGGGGSKTKWENPYDEFYNTVEKINEELRTREKLERRYQALLDKTGTKASDLVKNAQAQIDSLEAEKKMHEQLLEGRKRQMSDVEDEYKDLEKYARYNEETGTIEIDWEKINALDGSTNEKLTARIEEYIAALEERQEQIEKEEDSLAEIEELLREIRDQGKDEYFDFEEQIKDALIDQRQKEIDKLSAINDSINDTNSRLIDAMQSSIDKYRQDRENERTEEELSDKQRRLAYLQQDTSGANALEIMQLQEEIDQGVEDYTDQLIDQKINELQEQNDKAAEQREKQIAIAEAQLKKWEESGEIWNDVYELMSSGIDEDGIVPGSELQNLLKEAANFEGMSKLQKMDWLEELENNVAQAVQWLVVGNSTEALIKKGELSSGQQITFTTKDGEEVTGTLKDNGDVVDSQGNVYTDVYRDQEGNWVTEEETKKAENGGGTSTGGTGDEEDTSNQQQTNYPYGKASEVSGEVKYGDRGKKVKAVQWALKKLGYSIGSSGVDGIFGNDTLKAVKKFQRNSKISADGVVGKNTKKAFKLKQYVSGGLADFTGPAWLDGTKSKPEYILNAEQTKSFFELVDVLSGLKGGTSQSSQITGDSIYDVDINVESIGSDYDVEKLATTIKRMINDDARYRNNNAINLQR